MNALPVLAYGLLAIFVVSGIGGLVLRLLCPEPLVWHWHVALRVLSGQAVVMVLVEALLLSGHGSPRGLRWLGVCFVGAAIVGQLTAPRICSGAGMAASLRANKLMTGVVCAAWMVNLVVALAPSTKIDELNYHMLTPKRIVEDGGLRFYLLPLASAVTPHMHYQIALSIAHAVGAPNAGNVLSLGYSFVLTLFMVGFLADETGNSRLAVLFGTLSGIGLYATVWHTTGGAHALGDLATLVAVTGILLPEPLLGTLGPARYTAILVTASAVSAATKLSLWPLAFVVSVIAVYRANAAARAARTRVAIIGAALLPWAILHLPLMIWTYAASGSPWGPVFANVLGPSAFPPSVLAGLQEIEGFNPMGLIGKLPYLAGEFPPVFLLALPWLAWSAWRGSKISRLAGALLLLQGALVAWKFSFEFRYLGGMEYVAVVVAALTMAGPTLAADNRFRWAGVGEWLVRRRSLVLLFAAVPWLGLQLYYARPFAMEVSGIMTRDQFLDRYVALHKDFALLDQTLPRDAVLYLASQEIRLPDFYAPRPIVLTPLDLHGRAPVYRLTIETYPNMEMIDPASLLRCGDWVYTNDHTIIETYRTPGEAPLLGAVRVQSCEVEGTLGARGR